MSEAERRSASSRPCTTTTQLDMDYYTLRRKRTKIQHNSAKKSTQFDEIAAQYESNDYTILRRQRQHNIEHYRRGASRRMRGEARVAGHAILLLNSTKITTQFDEIERNYYTGLYPQNYRRGACRRLRGEARASGRAPAFRVEGFGFRVLEIGV